MTRSKTAASRCARLCAIAFSTALGSCAFDKIALPPGASLVVVHGVLNPGVVDQVVLVERALSGTAPTLRAPYDSIDPIVSNGGTPVRDARVVVRGPKGDSVTLREDRLLRADDRGAGVYRFANVTGAPAPGDPVPRFIVQPGASYQLRVTTPTGDVVTGATTVPVAPGLIATTTPRQFDRDRDSVFLGWPAVARAARFEVRVESPSGPYVAFVDSLEYLLAGSLVLPDATGRPRTFWPGFRQVITVSAVDSNYFDYYRSGSDPISSRGLLLHLNGGVGVFGSMARVRERVVDVVGTAGEAPAGRWEIVSGGDGIVPENFQLWRESNAYGATRLTGNVITLSLSAEAQAMVAVQSGTAISFAVLRRQSLRDTAVVVDARLEQSNASIRLTGTVRGTARAVSYRLIVPMVNVSGTTGTTP